MNRTIRNTAAALGVGALLAGGLAVTTAVAAPEDPVTPVGTAFGMGNSTHVGNSYGLKSADDSGQAATTAGRGRGYGAGMQNQAAAGAATTTQTATASEELAEALTFAREEERMARDLYAAIADRYDGALPFSRITKSEQQHFDAIGTLLTSYGVDDPAEGAEPGAFENQAIQDLYDGWWEDAKASLDDAYQVGIELEQRDIADLEDMIDADYPSDVDAVLSHLLQGSQNHLAAYQNAADGNVGTGAQGRSARGAGAGMMNGAGNAGDCPMADTDD